MRDISSPASDAPAPVRGVLAPGVVAMEAHLEVTIRDTGLGVTGGLLYLLTWLPGALTGLLTLWRLLRLVGGYVLGSVARSVLAYLVFTGSGLLAPSALSVVALVTGGGFAGYRGDRGAGRRPGAGGLGGT